MRIWWSGAMAVAAAALVFGLAQGPASAAGDKATGEIKDRDGKSLGTVEIVATSAGALIKLKLTGLPAGPHAIHFHETGTCEGDLSSAGAIYNPLGATHGLLSEEGPMAGDLTNIHADASGQVEAELLEPVRQLEQGRRGIDLRRRRHVARDFREGRRPSDGSGRKRGRAHRLRCDNAGQIAEHPPSLGSSGRA